MAETQRERTSRRTERGGRASAAAVALCHRVVPKTSALISSRGRARADEPIGRSGQSKSSPVGSHNPARLLGRAHRTAALGMLVAYAAIGAKARRRWLSHDSAARR